MSTRSGKTGRVLIGTYVVAAIQSWTWDGITNVEISDTALNLNFVRKHYGIGNFGNIEIVGNYDPDDSTGQNAIYSAASNKTEMTTLYVSLDASGTSKWVPDLTNDSSACAVITKANNIGFAENGMASVAFTVALGGQWKII